MAVHYGNEPPINRSRSPLSYLRDIRVIQVIAQIVFTIVLVGLLSYLAVSIRETFESKGLPITFDFLLDRAGFGIAESPEWYSSNSTYGEAFMVGIINTLRVVSIGLVGATVIGVLVGIFLLSTNWLVRTISRVYVEILRNTPLLVQLYFWYYVVLLSLPAYQDALAIPQEGFYFIPLKLPLYVLLFLGLWWYSRRASFPTRLLGGAILALVVLEVVQPVAAFMVAVALAVGLGLAIFAPRKWQAFGWGLVMVIFVQWLGTVLFELGYYFGLLEFQQQVRLEIYPMIYMSTKGLALPATTFTLQFPIWAAFVGLGIVLARRTWVHSKFVTETTGRPIPRFFYASMSIIIFSVIGWIIVTSVPKPAEIVIDGDTYEYEAALLGDGDGLPYERDDIISFEQAPSYDPKPVIITPPVQGRFNFDVGTEISPEYAALTIGLIIYTSAFIAEIVRAGIQAVPFGQIEASRAVGLNNTQTLQLVVLPQALRVILPPMGNQYLNLSKNSTLAIAVAFSDTYQVGTTMMNQSGQSISGFALVFIVYISLSLIISLVMNIINSRFQLVTR